MEHLWPITELRLPARYRDFKYHFLAVFTLLYFAEKASNHGGRTSKKQKFCFKGKHHHQYLFNTQLTLTRSQNHFLDSLVLEVLQQFMILQLRA